MKMFEAIKFDSPPTVLAAWPGMGNVGLITVDYLRRRMDAKVFAEIDMSPFFIPDSIVVKDGIAQLPEIPTSVFYYVHNPDLIIFESNAQISGREGIMIIKMILDVLGQFAIQRIYTFAAEQTIDGSAAGTRAKDRRNLILSSPSACSARSKSQWLTAIFLESPWEIAI